jgi:hypothetical protein
MPISRIVLATLAGVGLCVSAGIAYLILHWQFFVLDREGYLFAAPVVYKTLYVIILTVALYAVAGRLSAAFRAAWFAACAILIVALQYRRFGFPLYALLPQLGFTAVYVASLLIGWKLLRYFALYYKELWHRYFPSA